MRLWHILTILIIGGFGGFFGYFILKYRNPYKLIMIFGKKGAGKTTTLCMLAQKYIAKGRPVYSTEDIPGTYKIEPEDIGFAHFPENSVLLLDEVGMYFDNRNFKNFKPEVRDYFKLQRHYKHTVYLFSQTFDVDVKIRNLTDSMYMMVNYFGFVSVGKQIKRKLVVVKPSPDAESRIADELVISPLILTPFGARMFVWIPKYAKFFNSYAAKPLPVKEFRKVEYPEGFELVKKGRKIRIVHHKNKSVSDRVEDIEDVTALIKPNREAEPPVVRKGYSRSSVTSAATSSREGSSSEVSLITHDDSRPVTGVGGVPS